MRVRIYGIKCAIINIHIHQCADIVVVVVAFTLHVCLASKAWQWVSYIFIKICKCASESNGLLCDRPNINNNNDRRGNRFQIHLNII